MTTMLGLKKEEKIPQGINGEALPSPEKLREAKTGIEKETGHHSYSGRSEYIQGIMDRAVLDPVFVSGDKEARGFLISRVQAAAKAKYPWHASPAHVKITVLGYLAKMVKKIESQQEAPQKPAEKASRKAKGKKPAVVMAK